MDPGQTGSSLARLPCLNIRLIRKHHFQDKILACFTVYDYLFYPAPVLTEKPITSLTFKVIG